MPVLNVLQSCSSGLIFDILLMIYLICLTLSIHWWTQPYTSQKTKTPPKWLHHTVVGVALLGSVLLVLM